MADEDIDSLLEAGLKAATESKQVDSASKEPSSSKRSRSRSKNSRSPSRDRRSSRRHGRSDRDRRRRSRSRSARRHSSRRSRSRSKSPGRRSSRRRDRDRRSRSRSGGRRSRRSKSKSPSVVKEPRARSTSAERMERAKQRELMELTRDHRTVFIGQLTQKVREKDLTRFFSKIGKLEHVLLIRDKFTNRSKGFAYVEMSNLEDVPKVLLLNGQIPEFQVFPIMVKASEAEKNFAAKKDSVMASATLNASDTGALAAMGTGLLSNAAYAAASRIYCGNLHTNITEDDLRIVFQSFGEVVSVTINRDEMGRSKGFGFIQFSAPNEANFALSKGNGLELAGNYLKLGGVNENAMGGGGGGQHSGGNHQYGAAGGWKLDDDDGAGLSMNSQSRSALMAKLAGGKNLFPTLPGAGGAAAMQATIPVAPAPGVAHRAAALASVEIEGSPSFCFVVKNMFDVAQEKARGEPDWHIEIKEDVEDECSSYGKVLHSFVDTEKVGGLVYVLFDRVESAEEAAKKLHGRWFNQRQISVRYLSSQEYVGMFPEARSLVQRAREQSEQQS